MSVGVTNLAKNRIVKQEVLLILHLEEQAQETATLSVFEQENHIEGNAKTQSLSVFYLSILIFYAVPVVPRKVLEALL